MKFLAALVLCLCLTAEAAPSAGKRARGRVSATPAAAKLQPPAPARPTSPWVVDIHELVPSLRPMPQKEREDQLRDWALYGLLMKLELSADELARTTHQIAPMRLPYLEELFAFDYGRGRRAILSDERVLLLYEQSDPDPQATLGRLADRVRMETGSVPGTFEVYAFSADVAAGELRLEFKEALAGPELYSRAYGYSEAVVTGREELGAWLEGVDDVVYVAQAPEGVKLGGRRFAKSRTRSVRLEDVAALYQAHSGLVAQWQQQVDQYEGTLSRGKSELEASIPAMQEELARLFPGDRQAQNKELNRRLNERWKQMQITAREQVRPVPPEPGFSLDPRIKPPGLAAALAELAADPCRALDKLKGQLKAATTRLESTRTLPGMAVYEETLFKRDAADFRARCEALGKEPYRTRLQKVAAGAQTLLTGASEKEALGPLRVLRNELKGSKDETQLFLLAALAFAQSAHGEQCARYDGPLGGTRVGMNLFYTDLLAKLWTLDVQHSAPGMRVPGFISEARLPPTAYREEALALSTTRVWFGPRKEAFTRSAEDSELRFQHVATRVFAAGSDPDHPEYYEEAPAENSRRAVGWWERHYTDVADYEQEYHLQNQIMKWSVITGFFRAKELAPYLQEVPVNRTARFGKWYAQTRSELRYPLPLLVEGDVGQECMDLLSTDTGISGGVALAGTKLERIPALKLTESANLRHGLAAMPRTKPAPGELGRAFPYLDRPGITRVEPVRSTRTRIEGVEIELGPIELMHAKAATGGYLLALRTEHAPVGDFISAETGERIRLSWNPREIAEAPTLAQRVTRNDGAIPVTVTLYTGKSSTEPPFRPWPALVSVPETYDVLVPAASGKGYLRVRLSNTATAHSAPTELSSVLAPYKWQQFSVDHAASGLETSQGVVRRALMTGPGPDAQRVLIQGVDGFPGGLTVYAKEGTLYVGKPAQAGALQSWYALDESAAFTQHDLNQILTAAVNGEDTLQRRALSNPRAERVARALAAGDEVTSKRLLNELSEELGPEQGTREARRHLDDAADFALAQGRSKEATRLYDLATQHFGEAPPDVLIRQTLAGLSTDKVAPESLQAVLDRHSAGLTREERIQVMKVTRGLEDMPDVPEVVLAKLGFQSPIPDGVASRVRLERDGPDVVSTYHPEKALRGEPIAKDEFKQGVPPGASIYVEDGFSFNKNDFQASPSRHVAELGNNPEVEVLRVREMETGRFRPGKVYAKEESSERVYRRLTGATEVEKEATSPTYFIRYRHLPHNEDLEKCDTNRDGKVSEEERRQCKAA